MPALNQAEIESLDRRVEYFLQKAVDLPGGWTHVRIGGLSVTVPTAERHRLPSEIRQTLETNDACARIRKANKEEFRY